MSELLMDESKVESSVPPTIAERRASLTPLVLVLTSFGLVGAALLFAFDPAQHAFYPVCLFKKMTGFDCPGCGGLRAVHHLLRGDIWGAFQLNAMTVLALPVLLLWAAMAWRSSRNGKRSQRRSFVWGWLILVLIVVFGVMRNLPIWPFGITAG